MGTKHEHTIDEKGRITIPKDIRDALGLEPGEAVTIEVADGEAVIRPRLSRDRAVELLEGCITQETVREDAPDIDPMDPLGLDKPTDGLE